MLALGMAGTRTFICPECRRLTTRRRCPDDDTPTVPSELVKNPEKMDPLVGKTVDKKFHVEERLARGGMANVYRVVHQKTNAVLALKVLSRILVEDLTAVRRFYKEARLAATLRHPNTVRVFDVGNTDDGACYMAMEFLEGHSLGQEYRSGISLPVSRVVHVIAQILRSLGEAHEAGLVHRDLKPDNVFLINHYGVPDFVKVLDFGIAKAIREESEQLTQTGTVVGTPRYMSPEQAQGKPLDQRSDLYSLGIILYELLAGKPPFNDDIPVRLLMMHINDPPVSLNVIRPDISAGLCKLVMELLEKEPPQRPSSASDVLERITSLHIPPWIGHPEAEILAKKKIAAKELAKSQEESTDPHPSIQANLDTQSIQGPDRIGRQQQTTVSQPSIRAADSHETDPDPTIQIVKERSGKRGGEGDIPVASDLVVVIKPPHKSKKSRSIIWACLLSLCLGIGSFVLWQIYSKDPGLGPPPKGENIPISSESQGIESKALLIEDVVSSKDMPPQSQDVQNTSSDTASLSDEGVKNTSEDGSPSDSSSGDSHVQVPDSLSDGQQSIPLKPDPEAGISKAPVKPPPSRSPPIKRPRGPQVWTLD